MLRLDTADSCMYYKAKAPSTSVQKIISVCLFFSSPSFEMYFLTHIPFFLDFFRLPEFLALPSPALDPKSDLFTLFQHSLLKFKHLIYFQFNILRQCSVA